MKKFFLTLIATLCIGSLAAADTATAQPQNTYSDNWTILQVGFLPGAPSDMLTDPVYGIKIGAPISIGAPVWGMEASVLYSGSEEVNGIQCSLIYSEAQTVNGLQFSIVNFVQSCTGLQIGIINAARDKSIQLGLLNFIENGPLPWCILFNYNL
jgi:hypothetical protein